MPRFWVGCSGWNYKHWRHRFYPADLKSPRWFDFYAQHFCTVEINNTFYREAPDKTYDRWRDQAPDGFRFAVKAHRYLTHMKRLTDFEEPLERIIKGARRLEDHLGPILYQMPPAFKRNDDTVARLDTFLAALPKDLMHAMEFRDKSWYNGETVDQLRRHEVAYVAHDMGKDPIPLAATARFAYVRFHGSGGGKYHGSYPDEYLREYADRLRALAADEIWCYFNNDIGGHAITNARTLAEMLGADVPAGVSARGS